ncbi:hypothetical protein PFISCL1PPCAC_4212, partial [Pristionchus fissidentatus]
QMSTKFILILVVFIVVASVISDAQLLSMKDRFKDHTPVKACNEVCTRTAQEQVVCCMSHGFHRGAGCNLFRKMYCL